MCMRTLLCLDRHIRCAYFYFLFFFFLPSLLKLFLKIAKITKLLADICTRIAWLLFQAQHWPSTVETLYFMTCLQEELLSCYTFKQLVGIKVVFNRGYLYLKSRNVPCSIKDHWTRSFIELLLYYSLRCVGDIVPASIFPGRFPNVSY